MIDLWRPQSNAFSASERDDEESSKEEETVSLPLGRTGSPNRILLISKFWSFINAHMYNMDSAQINIKKFITFLRYY